MKLPVLILTLLLLALAVNAETSGSDSEQDYDDLMDDMGPTDEIFDSEDEDNNDEEGDEWDMVGDADLSDFEKDIFFRRAWRRTTSFVRRTYRKAKSVVRKSYNGVKAGAKFALRKAKAVARIVTLYKAGPDQNGTYNVPLLPVQNCNPKVVCDQYKTIKKCVKYGTTSGTNKKRVCVKWSGGAKPRCTYTTRCVKYHSRKKCVKHISRCVKYRKVSKCAKYSTSKGKANWRPKRRVKPRKRKPQRKVKPRKRRGSRGRRRRVLQYCYRRVRGMRRPRQFGRRRMAALVRRRVRRCLRKYRVWKRKHHKITVHVLIHMGSCGKKGKGKNVVHDGESEGESEWRVKAVRARLRRVCVKYHTKKRCVKRGRKCVKYTRKRVCAKKRKVRKCSSTRVGRRRCLKYTDVKKVGRQCLRYKTSKKCVKSSMHRRHCQNNRCYQHRLLAQVYLQILDYNRHTLDDKQCGKYKVVKTIDDGKKKQYKYHAAVSVSDQDKVALVVLKGSTARLMHRDWLVNIQVRYKHCDIAPGCGKVHGGFLKRYKKAIRGELLAAIKPYVIKGYKILIGGFSQGGALAAITAMDIQNKFNLPSWRLWVHTAGSPRVGNRVFQAYYNKKIPNTWRYVMTYKARECTHSGYRELPDTVTESPPHKWGYRHVGTMLKIKCGECKKRCCALGPLAVAKATKCHAQVKYAQALGLSSKYTKAKLSKKAYQKLKELVKWK